MSAVWEIGGLAIVGLTMFAIGVWLLLNPPGWLRRPRTSAGRRNALAATLDNWGCSTTWAGLMLTLMGAVMVLLSAS